jgi:hypothetical protein
MTGELELKRGSTRISWHGLVVRCNFDAYYADAHANGFAVVTTPFGRVQNTSLEWFQETIAADPAGDIAYFEGPV